MNTCMCKNQTSLQMNLSRILDYISCIFFISPSVDEVGLVEYFCTHPCFVASEEDPDYIAENVE